jgi:hypothetical protein
MTGTFWNISHFWRISAGVQRHTTPQDVPLQTEHRLAPGQSAACSTGALHGYDRRGAAGGFGNRRYLQPPEYYYAKP